MKYLAELSRSVTVLQTQNVCVGECVSVDGERRQEV